MSEHLSSYVHDHLAGSRFAIDMLQRLSEAYADDPLGPFAEKLRAEIEQDRAALEQLAADLGGRGTLKEATAWLAEKASRLKLQYGDDAGQAAFETLEALSLGILGKRALWTALQEIRDIEPRVRKLNLWDLVARAEAQHAEVEAYRLKLARTALGGQDSKA